MSNRGGQRFAPTSIQYSTQRLGTAPTSNPPRVATRPAAAPTNLRIPPNLSFVVTFEDLHPNYDVQPNRAHERGGFWWPPTRQNAYRRSNNTRTFYCWIGGRLYPLPPTDTARRPHLGSPYCCSTIFSQQQSTDHLFVVDYNAAERDVHDTQGEWSVLSFEHVPQPNSSTRMYSAVTHLGQEEHLAAPGSNRWMPQLLPDVYNYRRIDPQGNPIPPTTTSAGLIGDLALLLALAAFSAVPDSLDAALTNFVRPGSWVPHTMSTGRIPERGMIVTVYYDPANTAGSSANMLNNLRDGRYGPFYGA